MAHSGKKNLIEWTAQQAINAAIDADVPPFPAPGTSGWDGSQWLKSITVATAKKITVDGNNTYVALAPIGTAQADASWLAFKVAVSGDDTVVTWAEKDGTPTAGFVHVVTDLTALTYS